MSSQNFGSHVVPPALAFAEKTGAAEREVVYASKILGTFGAAAASGTLLGLTASQLAHGSNTPADYLNPALWTRPDIASVIDKVMPYAHDFGPGAPVLSARIEIAFDDGTILSRLQHGFPGHCIDRAGRCRRSRAMST
jgi:hypothetical protein